MEIEKDSYFVGLCQSRNLKPATITWYGKAIKYYCLFLNKTPTKLIEEAVQEEEDGVRKLNRKIRKYQISYRQHLIKKGNSTLTIKNSMATIRSFYNEYEIELPKIKLNLPNEERLITKEDLIQKNDINITLKYANIKYKAIILLMMSSGMGSSEMRYLTINDFLNALEIDLKQIHSIKELYKIIDKKRNPIATWKIKRIKTGMFYFTYSSPESIYAILDYLSEREKKLGSIEIDKPLFASNNKMMSNKSIINYFANLNDICGFDFIGRQRFFKAHNLRKFFASTLQEHMVPQIVTDWLLGHKIQSTTNAYFKPDINSLKKEYLRILPYLSLEEVKTRTVESDEYKILKEEYELDSKAKDDEIKNLKAEKDEEMAEMKRELNLVKDLLIDKGVRKELEKRDKSS